MCRSLRDFILFLPLSAISLLAARAHLGRRRRISILSEQAIFMIIEFSADFRLPFASHNQRCRHQKPTILPSTPRGRFAGRVRGDFSFSSSQQQFHCERQRLFRFAV
jgi:hypothetical protein